MSKLLFETCVSKKVDEVTVILFSLVDSMTLSAVRASLIGSFSLDPSDDAIVLFTVTVATDESMTGDEDEEEEEEEEEEEAGASLEETAVAVVGAP